MSKGVKVLFGSYTDLLLVKIELLVKILCVFFGLLGFKRMSKGVKVLFWQLYRLIIS